MREVDVVVVVVVVDDGAVMKDEVKDSDEVTGDEMMDHVDKLDVVVMVVVVVADVADVAMMKVDWCWKWAL